MTDEPAQPKPLPHGRLWGGIALAIIGLVILVPGVQQAQAAQAAQADYELGAFGRALITSDCTLDALGDKFGYSTNKSTIKGSATASCTENRGLSQEDQLETKLQQAQAMQGAGGAMVVGGIVIAAWPRRRQG